jgi:hypothetical protein
MSSRVMTDLLSSDKPIHGFECSALSTMYRADVMPNGCFL